ncbi:hypothetical protein [Trueperella bialowiezensis]|uniref:Uncharacterized protein n=1 Tax=Trueperella bialowiezensis TaxID=312285 RepID=A0A3S4V594_9ACTO|nr:hypothetical protein [Trueperella bialowiezensis]VEI12364.1 Uncharacterised protein [Trueperella bialowiezensis]
MSKFRTLLRIATTAGPAIYSVVRRYGPQIKQVIDDNPHLYATIKSRIVAIAGAGKTRRGPAKLQERIEVLREQTTYLYASANSAEVAEQTVAWRHELDALHSALPVIGAMKAKQRRGHLKQIEATVDDLSAKILALTLEDDIEDAQLVDDDQPPSR